MNSRLDEIQAAILRAKLPGLDRVNAERRRLSAAYDRAIPARFRVPRKPGSNCHIYAIHHRERIALRERLLKAGVSTGIHYPVPACQYARLGKPCDAQRTHDWCDRTITLPLFPGMHEAVIKTVSRVLRRFP